MSVLVCHFDKTERNPCECASLTLPCPKVVDHLGLKFEDGAHVDILGNPITLPVVRKCVILVSPTYFKQRKKMYANMPGTVVKPLLFSWSRLKASQLKTLKHIQSCDSQLYMASLLDVLRQIQRKESDVSFELFKAQILGEMKSPSQTGPLMQRLAIFDSLVAESKSYSREDRENGYTPTYLEDLVEPGTVIIADMTDPFLDSEAANGIFQVLLEQFRDTD